MKSEVFIPRVSLFPWELLLKESETFVLKGTQGTEYDENF
jgi:hypothetical protein